MDETRIKLKKFAKEKRLVEIDFIWTCCGINIKEKGKIVMIFDDYIILEDKEGHQKKVFIDNITEIQELKN